MIRAVVLLVGLALLACSEEPGAPSAPANRPNVLLLSLDTLRPDHLGCYGHDRDTSPSLDALAAGGVLFRDASTTAPWTLPAHASMLTGTYPSRHGVKDTDRRLARQLPTLATRLRHAGYRTLGIVNTHYLSKRYGLARGFDRYEQISPLEQLELDGAKSGRTVNRAQRIVDQALVWLRGDRDQPFFLFLHFYDTHTDFTPGPAQRERFVGPYAGELDGTTGQLLRLRAAGGTLDESDADHLRELYDAEIRELDDQLGRLFAFLERKGLSDETLVVVTSDHGEEFGEHGGVLHGRTHYQELMAVPLLMRGPGVPAGITVDDPVSLVDLVPTVLGRLGLEVPTDLDGIDLAARWQRSDSKARLLFGEADHNNAEPDVLTMVRWGRFKLCHDRLSGQSVLFDLASDPLESRDIAADRPDVAERLFSALEDFRREGAPPSDRIERPDDATRAELEALGYVR